MPHNALDINGIIVVRIDEVETLRWLGLCQACRHLDRKTGRTRSYNNHVVHRINPPLYYTAYINSYLSVRP
jgi:hypothetical protein